MYLSIHLNFRRQIIPVKTDSIKKNGNLFGTEQIIWKM